MGTFNTKNLQDRRGSYSGCLYEVSGGENSASTGANVLPYGLGINASLSSDRYGDFREVNPLYESCIFCLKY